ncbi:cell division cycle- protein [Dissophora globulifera]|uniref:M-phase inducer phosphatase n=1 Tax=Dissophora globulifera TaxID=979702 RepID=A0A9P6R861_9FUNG|nr:cell division cycle- protein [Dissophora globulifera]
MALSADKDSLDREEESCRVSEETSSASEMTSLCSDTESYLEDRPSNPIRKVDTLSQVRSKRQQDSPFEPNKRARELLRPRQEKLVNRFSQSARVIHERSRLHPAIDASTRIPALSSTRDDLAKKSRTSASVFESEVVGISGKSHSTPASASSFLSRLQAVADSTRSDVNKPRRDPAILMPPPNIRSRTFAGSTRGGRSISTSSLTSPFQTLESFYRHSSGAGVPMTALTKRSDQTHSLLKQAALIPVLKATAGAPSYQESQNTNDIQTGPTLDDKSQDCEQTDVFADDKGDSNQQQQPGAPDTMALTSCTAAMNSLSPPSAKAPALLDLFRRRRRTSITNITTSLSLPMPNMTSALDSDSDDEGDVERASYRPRHGSRSPTSPTYNFSSAVVTTSDTIPKRPTLRRHQTMISSRREFMRTLEFSGSSSSSSRDGERRTRRLVSSMNQKSTVFAPENYVPDPLREDCQILPCTDFVCKPEDSTKRVSPRTVIDVLDGKYKDHYDLLYIIDCRFPYEFEGGHIKSAVNVNTTDKLEELLLQPAITGKRVLLIFHCEFSSERGPRMARHLRTQDRAANVSHYPALFYSEVYVMEGGYSGFFKENKSYCWPEAYVEMQDEKHSEEFEKHMRTFGREFSRTASKGFLGTESKHKKLGSGSNRGQSSSTATVTSPLHSALMLPSVDALSEERHEAALSMEIPATTLGTTATTLTISKICTTRPMLTKLLFNAPIRSMTSVASSHTTIAQPIITAQSSRPPVGWSATAVSSSKESALPGVTPSLALSESNKPKAGFPDSSALTDHRPLMRARTASVLTERVSKDMDRLDSRSNPGSNSSSMNASASSNAMANPFFSGFRQTKPTFRGVSP